MEGPSVDSDDIEPRLYVIGPSAREPASLIDMLAGVLDCVQPVGFLLPAGVHKDQENLKKLRNLCREHATAFFVRDDPGLAAELDADGLHLSATDNVKAIRQALSSDKILGVDVRLSRHDAMVGGEDGADFVAIGQPGQPLDDETLNFITWWRAFVVLPSLAYAESTEAAARLAAVGADFIGVGDVIWQDPDGPADAARRLQAAIDKNRHLPGQACQNASMP